MVFGYYLYYDGDDDTPRGTRWTAWLSRNHNVQDAEKHAQIHAEAVKATGFSGVREIDIGQLNRGLPLFVAQFDELESSSELLEAMREIAGKLGSMYLTDDTMVHIRHIAEIAVAKATTG